jgi:hypothetical protein
LLKEFKFAVNVYKLGVDGTNIDTIPYLARSTWHYLTNSY